MGLDFKTFITDNYKNTERISRMTIKAPEHNYVINTYHYTADEMLKQAVNENNLYMSMNPIKFVGHTINRDKKHVARLKWLYVDLDIYKSEWKNFTHEQILMNLEDNYFGSKMPYPTYAVNSGRGMYLLWRIDEHVNATPRWEKVQRYFANNLIEFGADAAVVTDTARVLRVPGSINLKSGTEVKIMRQYDKHIYTLYEIMQEYMSDDISVYVKKNKKNALHNKNNNKSAGKVVYFNTPYSLLTSRLYDLEYLLLHFRDKEGGMRENILFLYRYWTLCVTDDKQKSLEKTLELNNRLNNPLTDKEVIAATKSAEKYYDADGFKIRNSRLIEFLNITKDEMSCLKSIITSEEKRRRKSIRNRKAYLESLYSKGEVTKADKIKDRHRAIYRLIQAGKDAKEICNELNISKSTYYADKQALKRLNTDELKALLSEPEKIDIENNENYSCTGEKASKINTLAQIPENSAHELREDVVLMSPYTQEINDGSYRDYFSVPFTLRSG